MILYEKNLNQIKLPILSTKCLNCFALNSVIYVVLFQNSERVAFFCFCNLPTVLFVFIEET